MKEIGGYFGLELGPVKPDYRFSHTPALNSGRHALEYILRQIEPLPNRVYLPYYTCEAVLEPLKRLNISWTFYRITESLEIAEYPELKEDEYIIVNNYFGIKDAYVDGLFFRYKDRIIIDDTQAFCHPNRFGMNAFYSPRKFVGVSDGGFAWTASTKKIKLEQDFSTDRALHLFRRLDAGASQGLDEFRHNNEALSHMPMKSMSRLTRRILETIDYEVLKAKRRLNFETLNQALASENKLDIPDCNTFACPMAYPFLTDDKMLRKRLIDNKIFVATYWPNVFEWCSRNSIEYNLAKYLLPLPIDQRYESRDMIDIIKIIK